MAKRPRPNGRGRNGRQAASRSGSVGADSRHGDHDRHIPYGVPDPEPPDRDGAAMQARLDEFIRAIEEARGTFIGIEHLTDTQIAEIRKALEDDCAKEPARYKGNNDTVRTSVDRLLSRY
jgi:hypothetical protein